MNLRFQRVSGGYQVPLLVVRHNHVGSIQVKHIVVHVNVLMVFPYLSLHRLSILYTLSKFSVCLYRYIICIKCMVCIKYKYEQTTMPSNLSSSPPKKKVTDQFCISSKSQGKSSLRWQESYDVLLECPRVGLRAPEQLSKNPGDLGGI